MGPNDSSQTDLDECSTVDSENDDYCGDDQFEDDNVEPD